MRANRFIIIFIIGLFFLKEETVHSEIYKWTDDKGGMHFTNDPSNIPPEYLDKVKHIKEKPSPPPSPEKPKESIVEKSQPSEKKEMPPEKEVPPNDPKAITVAGSINEELNKEKDLVVYSGSVRNNTNTDLNNAEMIFLITGKNGKEEKFLFLIKGKKGEGMLEPGEIAGFTIQPHTPFSLIEGYKYNFKWKFISTTQPK